MNPVFNDHLPPLQRIYDGLHRKFLVLSRDEARTVTPDMPYIVISLTDPNTPDATLADSPLRRAVLRLKFHDTGDYGQPLRDNVVMTADDARAILAFVRQHQGDAELIVCHCEAGASRSPATAAALSRIFQDEDKFFFANYWPNRWVYRTILDAALEELG